MREVSVCVPVYNAGAHLEDCLRSVAGQEGVRLEVVVLDDGSSDGSLDVARRVAGEFSWVRWEIGTNAERKGMVGNWNACLERTGGEFVKVMGQDDLLLPGCLARQVEAMEGDTDISLSAVGCAIFSGAGKRIFYRRKGWKTGKVPAERLLRSCIHRAINPLGEPVSILAKREVYLEGGGFDLGLRYYVDVEKNLRMLGDGFAAVIDEALCGFRIHRGAASFGLQGEAYQEFLEIERRFGGKVAACPHPVVRRALAGFDSLARLFFYRVWG